MSSAAPAPQRRLAFALLLGVVMVWGSTFVLVKAALADASPLLFNLLRFALAAILLLLLNWKNLLGLPRRTLLGGAVAGILLAAGYELQTAGLARTSAIHSAFLTGLVVVFVPLLSFFPALRAPAATRPGLSSLVGAGSAFAGLFLLTTPAGASLQSFVSGVSVGDLLSLGCALAFAAHLLSLSRLAHLPAKQLAPLQIALCALVMLVCLPLGGQPALHGTPRLAIALTLTALLATAAAFFIQTWAQQHLPATTTALVFTLEPVFALVFSMIFLGERLSARASAGAALILCGITLSELLSSTKPLPFEAA